MGMQVSSMVLKMAAQVLTATGCPYYLLEGQVMSGCGTNIPAVSLRP